MTGIESMQKTDEGHTWDIANPNTFVKEARIHGLWSCGYLRISFIQISSDTFNYLCLYIPNVKIELKETNNILTLVLMHTLTIIPFIPVIPVFTLYRLYLIKIILVQKFYAMCICVTILYTYSFNKFTHVKITFCLI